ncbi:hypothetical protein HS088_TW21G00254 [Tripterygium wilfordii]|uniref:Uncharacterized protein n=1 Tax=Tripterygium wilfordii TaxID=458696 RepID=A0A7J7C1Y5_TRIWF|nr:hypothetical protein HS088_TW21G00254 [Tripterygium wilfordii]
MGLHRIVELPVLAIHVKTKNFSFDCSLKQHGFSLQLMRSESVSIRLAKYRITLKIPFFTWMLDALKVSNFLERFPLLLELGARAVCSLENLTSLVAVVDCN